MTEQIAGVRQATVMDDETRRVARVYAESLYKSAEGQSQVEEVLGELTSLVEEVFKRDPGAELFLASAAVGRDAKEALIKRAFDGRASRMFCHFLEVLNHHDRLDMLRAIAKEYQTLHERKTRRVIVHVSSAVALTAVERTRLINDVRNVSGLEPKLQEVVDPEILGGLIVRVQDWVYDSSVKTRLQTIRNQLIERSSHGIQSGRDRFRTD
jgi:F-type H+-transporting ATPase subunit delta